MAYATSKAAHNIPGMNHTSGATDPVWVATEPYSNYPKFPQLDKNIDDADVVIVGGGIAGVSTAYECVKKGLKTVLIEARDMLSGETGRTSGHLSNYIDAGFPEMIKTFGVDKARLAFESHQYALDRIGQLSKELNIECEYRKLPGLYIVNVPASDPEYSKENDLREEFEAFGEMGLGDRVKYTEKGQVGAAYEGAIFELENATFHPTKYVNGILRYLQEKETNLFSCYAQTRMRDYKKHGDHGVQVRTEGALPPNPKPFSSEHGHHINAKHCVMTTNAPMHAVDLITKCSYWRTYCIAVEVPKGALPDVTIYDNDDPYVYVRQTAHEDKDKNYLIVGGEDHKVGFENDVKHSEEHVQNLLKWTAAHFPEASKTPSYVWSGQIIEPNDFVAFIGRDSTTGNKNLYVSTADAGNGLTHGVIASRLLTDMITGVKNPWEDLYSPARLPKSTTILETAKDNISQIAKYKRFVQTDVSDIEEIPKCQGAVMNAGITSLGKPIAVYKGEDGNVIKFSAICPHAHGVVAWNPMEKSWDCPVHGSRFDGMTGKCVFGPSNRGLSAQDDAAKTMIEQETSG